MNTPQTHTAPTIGQVAFRNIGGKLLVESVGPLTIPADATVLINDLRAEIIRLNAIQAELVAQWSFIKVFLPNGNRTCCGTCEAIIKFREAMDAVAKKGQP